MYVELFKLLGAIAVLWFCSEMLIKSSKALATRLRISDTFVGLTILSIGTTLPELALHVIASVNILQGTDISGVALGANVGSNIFQITAILGLVGLLMTVRSTRNFLETAYVAMLMSIVLLFVFGLDEKLSRAEGIVLAILYLLYLWHLGEVEHFVGKVKHESNKHDSKHSVLKHIILVIVEFAVLLVAAQVAITSAEFLADAWGVADSLIGSLILGLGAALPELAVALAALKHKSSGMSLGVLVGSNITNPLFAVGIGAAISTYTMPNEILWFDIPVWFAVSLLPFFFFWKKNQMTKLQAATLIGCFILFAVVRLRYFAQGI
ncbi:sodium:calcium antiporter [Candidatus Woesearchaeota archaeon]|nr:sodium:calcium antiporter [Candidatus Woesearchaeota archaeon]